MCSQISYYHAMPEPMPSSEAEVRCERSPSARLDSFGGAFAFPLALVLTGGARLPRNAATPIALAGFSHALPGFTGVPANRYRSHTEQGSSP